MQKRIGMRSRFGGAALFAAVLCASPNLWAEGRTTITFADDIQPILHYRCVECHQTGAAGMEQSGLDLTSYDGLMKGTKFGPVVVPKSAMTSNLLVLVSGQAEIRMPHNKKRLSPCEIDALRTWINQGAQNN
jgi:hypothetical protein